MHRTVLGLLLCVVAAASSFATMAAPLKPRGVMPWLCLQRCNSSNVDVLANIEQLAVHRDVVAGVSFEAFDLGPNSTVIVNPFTNVAPILRAKGFTTVAMVTTVNIEWMRQVFANPEPFLDSLVAHLQQWQIDGINVDWEPYDSVKPSDAVPYADFLGKMRVRLDAAGIFASVDIATWSPLWNLTLINDAMTSVKGTFTGVRPGFVATMNTYALPDSDFEAQLAASAAVLNQTQWLVGLDTWPGKLFSANVSLRFNAIGHLGLNRVAVWRSPVPDFWWPVIAQWFSS